MNCSTPGLPVNHQLWESTQTHVHCVGDAIQLSHPLSSPSPPAPDLSQNQGLLKWVSSPPKVAKYWRFSFSISPSNKYPGLISYRMEWLDLLAVQGTLKCVYIYICIHKLSQFSSVQSLICVWLFATPWIAARQASLSITNSQRSLKNMRIKSVMPSSHLILCCPLFLLPPIPPNIRVFSNESTLPMRWPKYWSFTFSINPSKEHPGMISFRIDWLDVLAVQGALKTLLQHHSSKASIFWCSAFFTVQLSHPYMKNHRKNHSLD